MGTETFSDFLNLLEKAGELTRVKARVSPILEIAACVVCHGGMGITQKALAAGVPVCAVPFGRDQPEVAPSRGGARGNDEA